MRSNFRVALITGSIVLSQVFAVTASAAPSAHPERSSLVEDIRFKVEKFQLDNGLTVILHEDHSAPIYSYHQWFRVGSRHEDPRRTGLAHFFEHLMFKGTDKYPGKKWERIIQANGGSNNAFTSRDYTGYYEDMPSGTLELIIDIESDRMRKLNMKQDEINSEREVVKEERRFRVENSIIGAMYEALFSTVFKVHNYRWPVIGSMTHLNATKREEFKAFYDQFYAPNNSVVVVVGAFDSSDAKKWIKKYYGDYKKSEIPAETSKKEPVQRGQRSVTLRRAVQSPTVMVGFQAPKAGHDDAYAFDLLSNILSNGNSSRLYNRLVYREQRATSISSWAYTAQEAGIFNITSELKPGQDVDRSLMSIYGEVYKLRNGLVSEAELEKAKNQVMTDTVNQLRTVSGKARALAAAEIIYGDYSAVFTDLDKYNKVTREQIQNVAKSYLKPEQRSVIRMLPKE